MSGVACRVRAVDDADFGSIADLTNIYINTTAVHFGYEPVSGDELRDAWWPKRERFPFLVALDQNDNFLGYAKSGAWRERAAYQWTAETGVYVAERAHGQGVGTALYVALIDQCYERGFHSLVGGITLPNDASIRLHERVGFRRVATFAHAGWKFGAWHDVAFYQLMLRDAEHVPNGMP